MTQEQLNEIIHEQMNIHVKQVVITSILHYPPNPGRQMHKWRIYFRNEAELPLIFIMMMVAKKLPISIPNSFITGNMLCLAFLLDGKEDKSHHLKYGL